MNPIDLRSDTVTRPTAEMRRAMAEAEVGDDLFGEDPTVRRLEEESAAVTGMAAALFVPSGTMGNEIALHVHGRPGSEVICEAESHVVLFESAAMAALSGLQPRCVPGRRGFLDAAAVRAAIAPAVVYRAPTSLISLENTAMMAGGTVQTPEEQAEILELARRHKLPVHLDGARIFNAAVALGRPVRELTAGVDSVMFTLSKGLGAPVGSMLCGGRRFIEEARRVRKMLGGAMRQAGVIAAAGLVALRSGGEHLARDHEHARRLGEAVGKLAGVRLARRVETNIVVAEVEPGTAPAFAAALERQNVLAVALDERRVRFVTHRDVSAAGVEAAIRALRDVA